MPVGDCERAFAGAAAADGIVLVRARLPWLNQRGHLGLPEQAVAVRPLLERIFLDLGGDLDARAGKRTTALPGDYLHEPTGTLIEDDESQHFTSHRLATLRAYPVVTAVGFDLGEYLVLCEAWRAVSDRYRASKGAVGFGPCGRQRQRAYHDTLRDLAAPAMGLPPVIRVPAPDRLGYAAYRRVAGRLRHLVDDR